ncbi:MAG: Asp-tRNA(Asn)/Glu-tRNA(Gln) amidotransferase subunit GatB [Bacteroidota bacterium]|jgi:aspartyl-tRNA(Asn)/glutamyl-tRNA(Gln) amidotransferase subunit B
MTEGKQYEAVIGLEVHAQLATNSKLFCADATTFGAAPNTQISPITMGHPGSLPKTNKKAVEYAIKMGLACGSTIVKENYFARKNYFYPDLPKGYQISQHTTPICAGGKIQIKVGDQKRYVQLNRIHVEEDAGKSIHDIDPTHTLIDLNRAGTPLIEIVTEPDLFSAEEAFAYVTEIRKLVQWLGICDGNMEEGSLRCDANVSVRLKGEKKLGTRVEVKNLNSIRNVKKSIEYEIVRLIEVLESGGTITQQTRSFDASNDTTFAIRDKEEANDYRYFPDPDLAPFVLSESYIDLIKSGLPILPDALEEKLMTQYQLNNYDATQICESLNTIKYFETTAKHTTNYKSVANWMLGPIKSYLNEVGLEFVSIALEPATLADLIKLIDAGQLNFSVAASKILPQLIDGTKTDVLAVANDLNLLQVSDEAALEAWIDAAIASMPDKVIEYQKGKKGLIGLFIGAVKKISQGQADPNKVSELLIQKLNK